MLPGIWFLFCCAGFIIQRAEGARYVPELQTSNKEKISRSIEMRVEFKIPEQLPTNSFVGQIPTKPGFTYRLNENVEEFILNGSTGELRTGKVIDRENLTNDYFDLVILSSQPTYPVEVRILIEDINEFPPVFPEPEIDVTFPENASPGTKVFLDTATDLDTGENDVTANYQIVEGNEDGHFRLTVTPNPSGEAPFLNLETTGKLDREAIATYRLNISAQDGGNPPKLGYLIVNIILLDINNNPPIFDHSDYVVSLNESAPIGTNVLQVRATDNDEGDNAKITYYLNENERQFSVDPETGDIFTMQQPLVCQKNCPQSPQQSCSKSCVFTVFAHDHGIPRQDGRTYITVNLIDTNDHNPIIKFTYFPPTASFASVDENAQNGSVVAAISILDMDEGLNGETIVDITSGNEFKHFRLESTPSFQLLRVNDVLDREKIGKYNLTIVATDKGFPSRSSTSFLIIEVNDINDHLPIFEKTEYSAVLRELVPIGSFVASIRAHDEDTGINSQVFYSFVSGNENNWFHIDSTTGLLTTINHLDREVQDTVRLKIAARDGGPNPKWAQTQIKITILDENERPIFNDGNIKVMLKEDALQGTLVTQLQAFDNDQGRNGSISYYLSPDSEESYPNTFYLDSTNGKIVTKTSLDRETLDSYKIVVIAKDQGTPSLSSSATVYLTLSDVNDNHPTIYPAYYFTVISRTSAIHDNIVQVQANYLDSLPNAKLSYYFVNKESGNDFEQYFAIEEGTGQISVKQSLRSLKTNHVSLQVTVKDAGGLQAFEKAPVEIWIANQGQDNTKEVLEFTSSVYNFNVTETFGTGNSLVSTESTEIGRIELKKPLNSLDLKQMTTYKILDGDDKHVFEIDETNGVISAVKLLDREVKSLYQLKVLSIVTNQQQLRSYGICVVNIIVNNVNDCSPKFASKRVVLSLPENTALGSEVYLAKAVDLDNKNIIYSLLQNPNSIFTINATNGIVSVNKSLQYLKHKSNELFVRVKATDDGQPPLSSEQTIQIIIKSVNKHTPVFDYSAYETSILESVSVNTRFFVLHATDEDGEENGQINYEIVEGNELNKFGIFPDGQVYLKRELDREEQSYFSLLVIAKDNGIPRRSSTVSLLVHVIDENDNPPQFIIKDQQAFKTKEQLSSEFKNKTYVFYLDENDDADSYVGRVLASDLDEGPNAELTYSIPNTQYDFTVDPKNGFVRSLRSFDREQLLQSTGYSFISLQVVVQDGGIVRLKDTAQVIVWIQDTNDNYPVFFKTSYSAQISESSPLSTQISRVLATDADEGLNGDIIYYFDAKTNEDVRQLFKIDSGTGQITLAGPLDRESQAQYVLKVVAQDMAPQNTLSTTTKVTITVLDENDNSPVFGQSAAFISVLETASINTELIQFHATDSDLGQNKQVSFSISGGNRHDLFRIDAKSGFLYLNKPLDYERQTVHILNITASDGGSPKLSSSLEFKVFVQDYNDIRPLFPSTAIVRQILEGIPINSAIVTVTAEDLDSGVNGEVRYAITSQVPPGHHFAINSNTGLISTLAEIDREQADTFRLIITATDQAEPESIRLSAEKMVTVIVEDLNDNEPIFVCMNAALISKNMSQNEIMKIKAIDMDSESNGIVTYEITQGDTFLFKLDRTTGFLSLSHQVVDLQPRYQLTIRATDEAIQSNRKSSDLYLTLLGQSDNINTCNQLKFTTESYKGSIPENEAIGTSVLTVKATTTISTNKPSPQLHLNGNVDIEYYITNIYSKGGEVQNKLFDIDVRRGIISAAIELDREMGVWLFDVEVYAIAITNKGLFICRTIVEIEVLDQPDQPPKFKWPLKRLNVFENTIIDYEVITLVATDEDTFSNITYSIVQGEYGKFSIDSRTGTVRVSDTLDRETREEYRIIVRANDGILYSDMTLLVQLIDANDNEPTFSQLIYAFDIPEDALQGYRVGQVQAKDPDKGVNGEITYSVLSDWGNDVFSVNPQTGIFTLIGRLDYEEVQHYIFVIQAQDAGNPSLSSTSTVYLNIQDLNDNAPVFNQMTYNKEVYENISVGFPIVTVTANDKDSGLNGKISYSIIMGNEDNLFDVSTNGTVSNRMPLDREIKASHALTILASDQGLVNQLSSSAQVVITVRDINDSPPLFISRNATYILENAPLNSVVLVVKATDKDESGRNTYIEYSLNNAKETFSLGQVDGLLRVNGIIDREMQQNFTLKITAKDRGEPPLSTIQHLFVRVIDANDNAPVFDPKHYSIAVPENSSVGLRVLQVSATDIDEGLNSQVRYSIVSGDPTRDFVIEEDSGIIRLAKGLNFERKRSYSVTIRAEDSGEEVLHDTASVTITVENINDSPPVFLHSPYVVFVRENIKDVPKTILHVSAYDADTGSSNQIRYLMKDGDKGSFRINASTGEISVHRQLDREQQSEYLLTVLAMDSGTPRLSGTGVIRIIVEDANDNPPKFAHDRYEFLTPENTQIGSIVSTINAIDLDEGLNGEIRYRFLNASPFTIEEYSGEIKISNQVDREVREIYNLILEASDSNPIEQFKAYATVTIRVLDMNDNSPEWSSALRDNLTVTISDGLPVGSYVAGVSASDRDAGLNGQIKYYLGGQDGDKFQINQITGVIKTLKLLKPSLQSLQLEVQAADSSLTEPLSAMAYVFIHVVSSNRFPKIKPGRREFSFVENIKDAYITTVEGYPLNELSPEMSLLNDTGTNSRKEISLLKRESNFNYVIGGGNLANAFDIGRKTGQLKISSTGLDYELCQEYELWVEVFTNEQPNLRSSSSFRITVLDENDNAPKFHFQNFESTEKIPQYERSIYEVSVPEEEPGPKLITILQASDADSGKNGQIKYRLSETSSKLFSHMFDVNADSGEFYTKVKLDREEVEQYTLNVEAYDLGSPSKTGSATLIVTVSDVNDHPPRFTRLFSVNVTENVSIGTFVIQVTSVDKDIGENAQCTYSLTENSNNKFKIDPISGNITVNGMLDRETQDEHLLRVVAIDGSWRAETLVSITIQDVNDNTPLFDYSFYSFNVAEHGQHISFVGQVSATDRDKRGPNSIVAYRLKTTSKFFTIDPVSGEIFSKKSLKYKTSKKKSSENEYHLVVFASDSGKPPLSTECSVLINVVHKINHPPVVEKPFYFSAVPETFRNSSKVIQIKAMDELDYGINAELEYLISKGNGSELFDIEKDTGWIIVKENLTLSSKNKLTQYFMDIKITDKGITPQATQTKVKLVIVGENKFKPVFSALSYRVIVPENEALGSVIVTVNAVDEDAGPNGQVRYNITSGNEAGKFKIESLTGDVSINKELDYDTVSEYQLNITAYDSGYYPKISQAQLSISLTDINDNPPRFNSTLFVGYIKENAPPNTQVMQLIAEDIDSPKFSVILYSIVGGTGRNLFVIDRLTGIIVSKQSFDYEEKNVYTLEIIATNPDSKLYNATHVEINVQGVNEYVPKFIQPVFHFSISESAPLGSSIGIVQATDQDDGDDGIVYYLFIGSSNDAGFSIDTKSGTVSVARLLDRESQSRVVLSVLVKNAGSIYGNDTDEAQVVITIQDGNDPPMFEKILYEAEIKEGAPVGSHIVSVKAHDVDMKPSNNRFSYKIMIGDDNDTFNIDPHTGVIQTVKELDRETVDYYCLTIGAIDHGDPQQTGTTSVKVYIHDIQDNAPFLDPNSLHGSVFENEPPNTKVMTLKASDLDLSPNAGPFKYKIVAGLHKEKFKLDKNTGELFTTSFLDREALPTEFNLTIQIEDNGNPVLKSLQSIKIRIQDVNDSPSQPRNAQIMVYTFKNMRPVQKIATVQPIDPDIVGQYTCQLDDTKDLFSIPSSCDLYLKSWPAFSKKQHSIRVNGDDGLHAAVKSTINVEFHSFDNRTLDNSIVLRILKNNQKSLLRKSYTSLRSFLRQIFQLEPHIYSIITNSDFVDLVLTIGSGMNYEEPENVGRTLQAHKSHLETLLEADIIIKYSPCTEINNCLNGASCMPSLRAYASQTYLDSPLLILSSPIIRQEFACQCSNGFIGDRCELQKEPCNPNPCENSAPCIKQGSGYYCVCPLNKYGERCELDKTSSCDPNPCQNGGSCKLQDNGQSSNSYFCLCRPGFYGSNCSTTMDVCKPNPCQNDGECISGPSSSFQDEHLYSVDHIVPRHSSAVDRSVLLWSCKCPSHYYGRYCEKSGFGFGLASFMTFASLDSSTNDIAIIFSTTKPNSLLVYNYGEQIGGRSDFVAIELIQGRATFSFGGVRTAVASVTVEKYIADGKWYRIVAIRNSRLISLSVANCEDSGEQCGECNLDDSSCYADNQGFAGTLSFNGNSLYIGGLKTVNPILERPGQLQTDDFIGCVHSVEINGRMLNLSSPMDSQFISKTCQKAENICQGKCGSKDQCVDLWDSYTCDCNGFFAMNCEEAVSSFTFSSGSFVEFKIGKKYERRMLLDSLKLNPRRTKRTWQKDSDNISFNIRTVVHEAVIFYAATNKDYTLLELEGGTLKFTSKLGSNYPVTMKLMEVQLNDGFWHNIQLVIKENVLQVLIDNENTGDDLSAAAAHNFLDPYLTTLLIGDVGQDNLINLNKISSGYDGCFANFTVNGEIQTLNGSGSLFDSTVHYGKIGLGCSNAIAGTMTAPDPLSIGVTLVIVFFVILLVAILVSFVVFHLRKREKSPLPSISSGGGIKANSTGALPTDVVRNHHVIDNEGDALMNFVRNSKKMSENILGAYNNKPDVIVERSNNISSSSSSHQNNIMSSSNSLVNPNSILVNNSLNKLTNGISLEPSMDISEMPEHYDLENASSIAPSDIDIVYHYKGFRDNVRGPSRNKSSPFRHNHHFPNSLNHRQGSMSSALKSTPLARLSPSSELSQQTTPRILTLQDISGRSMAIGLTAEEIERLNNSRHNNNDSSLVSTLDAVSSSASDDDNDVNNLRRRPCHNSSNKLDSSDILRSQRNNRIVHRDTTSEDDDGESVNDSFTCSEFEYDNNSSNANIKRNFRSVSHEDDLAYVNSYNKKINPNTSSLSNINKEPSTEGWNYLLNWGPNYSPLANVFKDIAELPDCSNNGGVLTHHDSPNRNSNSTSSSTPNRNIRNPPTHRPSEEYV